MITNKVGKVMAIIIYIIFVLIMGTILYLFFKEDQVFTKEGLQMVNIVDKAKEIDGDKFIHYQVEGASKDSKELIAVHFNTNSENNIGFIDEYGNVVKEPFLSNPYYDYYETVGGENWSSYYVGEYYEDIYSNSYYNRNFEKVELTEEEITKFKDESYRKIEKIYQTVSKEEIYNISNTIKQLTGLELEEDEIGVTYTGELYNIGFSKNGFYNCILLDREYKLLIEFYYCDGNENQFSAPVMDSKVGCVFIRNVGLVYYNTDRDIIWITYCRDKATK